MQKVSESAAFLIEARRCLTEEQREDHEAAREFCRSCCQAAGAEPAFDFLEDFWVAMTLAQCGLTEGGNIDGSGMGPRKHDNIQGLRKINPYQLESMVREYKIFYKVLAQLHAEATRQGDLQATQQLLDLQQVLNWMETYLLP